MKKLVLVESPSKAHTINKYLGKDYIVKATVGHIKNLPKNSIGVDIENGFEPKYEIIKGKEKTTGEIKKLAKNADTIYLAPDPDREGEAIAWNIKELIDEIKGKKPEIKRVLFHEITKDKVIKAIENPTELNKSMYESQKARRILDRLVGYNLSPFLWEKIRMGLSAGRVQSVALYLIAEKEREVNKFVEEEFWTIRALFDITNKHKNTKKTGKEQATFALNIEGDLVKINGKEPKIENEGAATELKTELLEIGKNYSVEEIAKKQVVRKPPSPFITSTLQQEAAKILRFSVKKTMSVAQKLYEGIEVGEVEGVSGKSMGPIGLITYMRTDSTRISSEAEGHVKDFIGRIYGSDYLPVSTVKKKSKAGADAKKVQDAHEAIRPTNVSLVPKKIKDFLTPDEYKLYNLIWTYFTASFMSVSIYDRYSITLKGIGRDSQNDKSKEYSFRTTESVLKFDGFQRVINENIRTKTEDTENEKKEGDTLPALLKVFEFLSEGDPAVIKKVDTFQHFTLPPSRYTEASLVKALDENGIGRPSTYQSIISNIKNKDYVTTTTETALRRSTEQAKATSSPANAPKKGGSTLKFKPTELGIIVSDILKAGFSDIINLKFTANMEVKLDNIEKGLMSKNDLLTDFYDKFMKSFNAAKKNIKNIKGTSEPTDIICEKCGKPMVIKMGRFGKFLACSGYPECKNTKEIVKENTDNSAAMEETDEICEKCGKPMVIKMGRFGKFLACSGYPECKNTKPVPVKHNKSKISCPTDCGGYLTEKRTKKGRRFFGCSNYPKCDYATWTLPAETKKETGEH